MTEELQFWEWFKKNEAQYYFLNQITDGDEKERLLNILLEHLHAYCNHLFFEVGGYPDRQQELIISAEGNSDFFAHVEALVATAPSLEHWDIIAFKPARPDLTIEYSGIILDASGLYFIPLKAEDPKKVGLRIFVPNYSSSPKEDLFMTALLLLDNILGEKSNALDIASLELEDLLQAPNPDQLIELVKLPRYIAWAKKQAAP